MNSVALRAWLRGRTRVEAAGQFAIGLCYLLLALITAAVVLVVIGWLLLTFQIWFGLAVVMVYLLIGREGFHTLEPSTGVRMFMDIFQATPRLLREGFACFRRSVRWLSVDARVCADTLAILLGRSQRVSFAELAYVVNGFDTEKTVAQLQLLDGIVVLPSPPAGLSLTGELREELGGEAAKEQTKRTSYGGERVVRQCEACGARLRIRVFLVGMNHRCPRCLTRYRSFRDADGYVHLERETAREPEVVSSFEGLESHDVLGVAPDATDVEIKRAYRKLMKQNHPDLFSEASPEQRRRAEERTKAINQAYHAMLAPLKG